MAPFLFLHFFCNRGFIAPSFIMGIDIQFRV